MQRRVLLGVTGSVAALKAPQLVAEFLRRECEVRVVATEKSMKFFDRGAVVGARVFTDEDEWAAWHEKGDPVQHVELRKWADVLVVAPLSADSMAKFCHGLCDDLLSCVVRAWDFAHKPVVLAPAMNTLMWQHPLTKPQCDLLTSWGCVLVPPVCKTLACGDVGQGALADIGDIVEATRVALSPLGNKP